MRETLKLLVGNILLVTTLLIGFSLSACTQDNTVKVVVSPNILNLESSGGVFTIHADVKYDKDLDVRVYLNNDMASVSVSSISADSKGNLVVKCDILDVKEIVLEGTATVKLKVYTEDGVLYSGTDIIDIISKGK